MLELLRKGAAGWVAKIFLGVLVLSFAVWGVADIVRVGGPGDAVATIGEQDITTATFRQAYNNEIRRISEQAKRVITPEQARLAGFGERVLGNLVNEAALDAQAKRLGLTVSDDEVAREIAADELFRGPAGSFDRAQFDDILRSNNLREADYVALQRGFSARRQLTDALTLDIEAPAALREALHVYSSDSRSIQYIALAPEQPAAVPAPSDQALTEMYEQRKASFAAPEYRKLALLTLDAAALARRKQVSEAELRAYYEQNRPAYAVQEKRSIEQITYPSVDEARQAYDRIKAGGLFEQEMVRRKLSPQDAFLGNLAKADLFDRKIADAAFALQPNTVSDPVEGAYATVLLRVTGVQQEQAKRFEDVRDEIRSVVAERSAKADLQGLHDKIDEARLGGATLDEIAKAEGLAVAEVAAVDPDGNGPDGRPIPDLPLSDKLLPAAFAATVGAENEAVGGGDAFAWYEVREMVPGRERSFAEARASVETRWREEEARKRLTARADALIGELNGGKTLEQAAEARKLAVEQAETTRTGGAPNITAAQANAVFAAPVEGFGKTGPNDQGARLVFRVTSENTRPFDPKAADTTGQAGKIAEGLGVDLVSAFVRKLRDQLGTTFDERRIAEVTGGGEG